MLFLCIESLNCDGNYIDYHMIRRNMKWRKTTYM
nr:MAG TPA: hypothetical protein [Caudoviricetes sp.]